MKKALTRLYDMLQAELEILPASEDRKLALAKLKQSQDWAELADADKHYNPPGKVVVRNAEGEVTGLQG